MVHRMSRRTGSLLLALGFVAPPGGTAAAPGGPGTPGPSRPAPAGRALAEPLVEQAKLTASEGQAGDVFGHSVAIRGDTVVVGARTTTPCRGRSMCT